MALRHWSTTPSGNANTAGINWAEGQPPSTVNDSARQEMAQVRQQYRPDQWHWVELSNTASVASQTSFRVSTDLTSVFHAQRRVRLSGGSTTRYASVVSSSFTAETTVTVAMDAGSLSSSHNIAALGPSVTGSPSRTDYLPLAGGTLAGDLTISKANVALALNAASGDPTQYYQAGGLNRFVAGFSVVGNYWYLNRYNDAGTYLGTPVTVDRSIGNVDFANSVAVTGAINASSSTITGNLKVNGTGLIQGQITTFASEALISNPGFARLRTNTSTRAWTAGTNPSGQYDINDETGASTRVRLIPGGSAQIFANVETSGSMSVASVITAGNDVRAHNDFFFRLGRSGAISYFQATADDWMQFNDSASSWDLILAGAGRLGVTPSSMIWGPAGHTFLIDGIFHFRTFPTGGLPSAAVYSPTWVARTSAPGDWAATNDSATWQLMHFV